MTTSMLKTKDEILASDNISATRLLSIYEKFQMNDSIPPHVLDEFSDYTRLYEANGGNGASLQAKYGKTYWFYFHYATMKKGK